MATLQAGEYFGERCLRKEWRANMHVIAKGTCMVYTINKFDLVTLLTPSLRAALIEGARFDDLDDDTLCNQFQKCAHFALSLLLLSYFLNRSCNVLVECLAHGSTVTSSCRECVSTRLSELCKLDQGGTLKVHT